MKSALSSPRGMTLVEVLVGIGLISVILVGMMTLISNSYKHETNLATLLEGRELSGELIELSKSANCGLPDLAQPIPVKSGTWSSGKKVDISKGVEGRFLAFKAGDSYGRFKIEDISLQPYFNKKSREEKYVAMDGSNPDDFATASIIRASLALSVSSQGAPRSPIRVPVYLFLDTSKTNIIGCEASLEDKDMVFVCGSLGGNWIESEARCQLPCPGGMNDVSGVCVAQENGDSNSGTFCNVNERCGVESKFILGI